MEEEEKGDVEKKKIEREILKNLISKEYLPYSILTILQKIRCLTR